MLELEILPYRLLLAKFKKEHLPLVMYTVLHAAFFRDINESPTERDAESFFSFTESSYEISLIIDSECVKLFENFNRQNFIQYGANLVEIYPVIWRCLEVFPGKTGSLVDDILSQTTHKISSPLANAGISIFQVSTTKSDFTLVPETDIRKAIRVLRSSFNIINEDLSLSDDAHSGATVTDGDSVPISEDTRPKYPMSFPISEPIYIATLRDPFSFDQIFKNLVRVMFYSEKDTCEKSRIFSFTVTGDQDTSFLMDKKAFAQFPEGTFNLLTIKSQRLLEHGNESHVDELQEMGSQVMQIGEPNIEGLGFDEPGIVSYWTSILAKKGLSWYYLSTYSVDFILVGGFKDPSILSNELTRDKLR